MANFHTQAMKTVNMNQEDTVNDPIKESYLTIETFKEDNSTKTGKRYIKRKNIMYGNDFYERYDTPHHCSASSESYWSN
tara:strand:+ start:1066 stop:1302 length:237 start_codon:yes stop_codon:yes gene_type:complete